MFVGGSNGLITGVFKAVIEAFVEVKNFHVEYAKDAIDSLWHWKPNPLPVGKKPFDVSPFRAVYSLLCGALTVVIYWPLFILVGLKSAPRWGYRLIQVVWDDMDLISLSIVLSILSPIFAAIVIAGFVVSTLGFSLGSGVYEGYTRGLISSFVRGFKYVKELNTILSTK